MSDPRFVPGMSSGADVRAIEKRIDDITDDILQRIDTLDARIELFESGLVLKRLNVLEKYIAENNANQHNNDQMRQYDDVMQRLDALDVTLLKGAPTDIVTALSSIGSRIAALEANLSEMHERFEIRTTAIRYALAAIREALK